MTEPKKTTVVYHRNCVDGITAAFVARQRLPHATFVSAEYGEAPPKIEAGEILYILDFSYPISVLRDLCKVAELVIVIDHHKTTEKMYTDLRSETSSAQQAFNIAEDMGKPYEGPMPYEVCPPNLKLYVDIYESGAQLAWKFFNGMEAPEPTIVTMSGDADLWRFKIPGSRQYSRACGAFLTGNTEADLAQWEALALLPPQNLIDAGEVLERSDNNLLDWYARETQREFSICLDGDEEQGVQAININRAPMFNAPKPLYSALNDRYTMDHPLVVSYFDTVDSRVFRFNSHRDNPNAVDCEVLATRLGGGGHTHSASVRVPRDHWLAKI